MCSFCLIVEGTLQLLKHCNTCCKNDTEDSDYDDTESISMTKRIRRKAAQPAMNNNQNTVNPVINITVNSDLLSRSPSGSIPVQKEDTEPVIEEHLCPVLEPPFDLTSLVKWIPSNNSKVDDLKADAVIGGYDIDGSEIWVIRTTFQNEILPAKLNLRIKQAFVAIGNTQQLIHDYEVCCAPADRIRWMECSNGNIPPNAIIGGKTKSGEKLYIGRTLHATSLCLGKVLPSDEVMYVPYAYEVHAHRFYDVMCIV